VGFRNEIDAVVQLGERQLDSDLIQADHRVQTGRYFAPKSSSVRRYTVTAAGARRRGANECSTASAVEDNAENRRSAKPNSKANLQKVVGILQAASPRPRKITRPLWFVH
jgi:hypothetical protein